MSGSSPPPSSSPLTYDESEPPLVAEMWGLLKALMTQLHVNVELPAPSSSSTAMEPSPVQGNRRKDKAPTSKKTPMMMMRTYPNLSQVVNPCPLRKGLVLPSTTLAHSTPGPSRCPTRMRILLGRSRRYQSVPTAPSPQTIMWDSPRRISSMSRLFVNSSRPYAQHSSCVLAWQRMGMFWWTSTLSFSPSSTPSPTARCA